MKRIISSLLTIAIAFNFVVLVPKDIRTEAATVYNLNDYADFSSRSKQEIADGYYDALSTRTTSYYEIEPSFSNPYSGGKLSDDTHKSITNMLNFYRWLMGVGSLPVSVHSDTLQAGALVRNYEFDHSINYSSKPEDMSDDFWNLGASCSHNILSSGYTPQGAITGYLNEGYNLSSSSWNTIGHRAMLLSYKTNSINFGYAGKIGIGKRSTSSTASTDLPFVAFPCPGYIPNTMITSPNRTSWSVELNTSVVKYNNLSDLTVTVKNLTRGTSYDCTFSNGKLKEDYGMLTFVQPEAFNNEYLDEYEVIITGLVNTNGGGAATLQYSCEFFDPSEFTYTDIERASVGNITQFNFSDKMSLDDIKSISSKSLSLDVNFICANGRKFSVQTTGGWNIDSTNKQIYTSISSSSFPEYVKDSNGIASRVAVNYSQGYFGLINADKTDLIVGDSTSIKLTRYYTNTTEVCLYKVASDGTANIIADQTSPCFSDAGDGIYSYFNLTNLKTTDSGTYFIIYNYDWSTERYVVGPLSITVSDKPIPTNTPTSVPTSAPTNAPTNGPTGAPGTPTSVPSTSPTNTPVNTPTSSVTPGTIPTPVPTETPSQSVGDFVARCYKVALNRDYDTEGYNYWCDQLNNGRACGAQVGYGFIFGEEYKKRNTTDEAFIFDLYNMYFGRTPDSNGYDYWLNLLKSGHTREEVFAGFANSLEFKNLCDSYGVVSGYYALGVPNEQQGGINCFVARLYSICLNRLPDQAGQADWVIKLLDGSYTGSTIAYGFIFSPEFAGKNMTNEEYVAYLYRAFFGREPDTEGFKAWVQDLLNGQDKLYVFRGFVNSQEFDNLCKEYGIIKGTI